MGAGKSSPKGQLGAPYPNRDGAKVFPITWRGGVGPATVSGAQYREGQTVKLGPDGQIQTGE